jgi:hypothetical protein
MALDRQERSLEGCSEVENFDAARAVTPAPWLLGEMITANTCTVRPFRAQPNDGEAKEDGSEKVEAAVKR